MWTISEQRIEAISSHSKGNLAYWLLLVECLFFYPWGQWTKAAMLLMTLFKSWAEFILTRIDSWLVRWLNAAITIICFQSDCLNPETESINIKLTCLLHMDVCTALNRRALPVHATAMTVKRLTFWISSKMQQENVITLQRERREIEGEKAGEKDMRQLVRAATQDFGSRIYELCLWRIPALRPLLLTIHRISRNQAAMI